jgi:hypothetical protein
MKSILLATFAALIAGAILIGPLRHSSFRRDRDRAVPTGNAPATIMLPTDSCSGLPLENASGIQPDRNQENMLFTKNIIISLL